MLGLGSEPAKLESAFALQTHCALTPMSTWKHGYYADSGYTYGFYPETMPSRLFWAALLQGHQSARSGFRYLDAGCGQGLNLILAAAAHPDGSFVGIDFLPEHVAHANRLAERCGLRNVQFIEGDFVELARAPQSNPLLCEPFDFAVCHGISTWIAPPVKSALFSLVGQVLKPGGLFYNSYNTYPGWLAAAPFQHLVLLEQRSQTGALALKAAQDHMEHLKQNSGGLFKLLPALEQRLESMKTLDPAYLVQEYNNQHWAPVFVSQMMDDLGRVKLSYLGSATLPEAFDAVLPQAVREHLSKQQTQTVREQLRDYALNQSFRRDLYVKGMNKPWPQAHNALLRECRFVCNPLTARPAEQEPFKIKGGSVELNGEAVFYHGLLDQLAARPEGASVQDLINAQTEEKYRGSVVQAMSMMLHGGWVLPLQPAPKGKGADKAAARAAADEQRAVGARVNAALAAAAAEGAPYRYASLPRTGLAMNCSETDMLLLHAHHSGVAPEQWPQALSASLKALNRNFLKDGKPISDEAEYKTMLQQTVEQFSQKRLPLLRQLGGV